jgi:L-alanine-DL-glutamate epimerase-like enolase superfamily enzyme
MQITAVETLRLEEHPNVLWVRIHTDEGFIGLGETYFMPKTVEAYIHEWAAPRMIGRDPRRLDKLVRDLRPYLGGRSAGAETRGNSAIDIALWDLLGKIMGVPVHALLGGAHRESIRVYNTCAGSHYMRKTNGQRSANWGLAADDRYDDLNRFLNDAGGLAKELLDEGITAMKIWPFDPAAEASGGVSISVEQMRRGLAPVESIRAAVGTDIDVMIEFHSLWMLTPALQIARALAPFQTYWHEDPIQMESLADLRRYAEVSIAPVCASETLGGVSGFRDLLQTDAAGIVMLDLSWCGGISEARKIATLAEAWRLPIAPHDCTGPVVLAASTHICLAMANALIQETVRAYHRGWYNDVAMGVPPIERGQITVAPGPGLGIDLHPELADRFTLLGSYTDAAGHASGRYSKAAS